MSTLARTVLAPAAQYRFPVSRPSSSTWLPYLLAFITLVWLSSFVFDYYLSLIILTYVGVAIALVGLFHPSIGLMGIGIICTIDPVARSLLGDMIRFNTINYVLLLSIVVGLPLLQKMTDTQTRLLQAMTLLFLLGLTVTEDIESGSQHMLNVFSIFGLSLYYLRARRDPQATYNLALVNGVVAGVGGLAFFLQIDRLPWLADDEQGRFMNANAFAFFPLAGIFSICLAYHTVKSSQQTKLVLLALATLFSVFLSGSRSGIIVGTICLVYLLITTRSTSQMFLLSASIPVIALTSVALFPSLQDYAVKRFMKMFDAQYSLTSRTSGRSDVALVGVSIFLKHPLGVGTGGFSGAYEQADADEMAFAGIKKQAHSAWVKTLVENGAMGMAILAAYVFSFYFTALRTRRRALVRVGFFVSLVLTVAFLGTEMQSRGLWLLACGATALLNYGMGQEYQALEENVTRC